MPLKVEKVIGVDLYNQSLTGGASKTLNAIRSDADHTPCVLIQERNEEDNSGEMLFRGRENGTDLCPL